MDTSVWPIPNSPHPVIDSAIENARRQDRSDWRQHPLKSIIARLGNIPWDGPRQHLRARGHMGGRARPMSSGSGSICVDGCGEQDAAAAFCVQLLGLRGR